MLKFTMIQAAPIVLGLALIVILAALWARVQREHQLQAIQAERIMNSLRENHASPGTRGIC